MKFRFGRPIVWAVMTAAGLSAAPVEPPKENPSELASILTRLSDESYSVREAATQELWKLGERVIPELRRAAEGRDPEVAIRARELLRKIELGILPDSSPKIVEQVMLYDRGSLDERQRVIVELRKERAYRQILKLYALEKDENSLAMLESQVRGVAVDAARDCLTSTPPDVHGAFTYLKMARPEAAEYMAMASLHRVLGTLDEELKKSASIQGKDGHLYRYALLSAAGRLNEAAAEAEEAELPLASARLQLISGDPLPWLQLAPSPPQMVPPAGLANYREYAISTWQGKPVKQELTRDLRRMARMGDEDDQAKALMMLFLTGDYQEAEKLLEKRDSGAAFYHFESSERIPEALKILGIDSEKPDYTAWALKRFRVLIDDPDAEEREIPQLGMLGYFLERRGLFRELDEAFVAPLMELAESNQENFLLGVTRLFTADNPEDLALPVVRPVLKACTAFAGDDDVRWMQIVESLFEAYPNSSDLWRWLADLDPALDRPARLEWMCRILEILPDTSDQRGAFYEKAWQAIGKAEKNEHRRLLGLLADASQPPFEEGDKKKGNAATYLRALEEIEKIDGIPEDRKLVKGYMLSATGRWNDAAQFWIETGKDAPGEPVYFGFAAACLRKAGDEAGAVEMEKKAELLAMGETRALSRIGDYFGMCGDFPRARAWWERAAAECTNDSRSFSKLIQVLGDDASAREDWKRSAAFGEAYALEWAMSGLGRNELSSVYLRQRLEADFSRGFAGLEKDREASIRLIGQTLEAPYADLLLADYFFAPMREAGLVKMHDEAFEKNWKRLSEVIARFPDGDNTRNSAAWLASRANRRLDEAEKHLDGALKNFPRQAAYLDTMAEVQFARGDRAKALDLSNKGLNEEPLDLQLIRQHQRFTSGAFPPK